MIDLPPPTRRRVLQGAAAGLGVGVGGLTLARLLPERGTSHPDPDVRHVRWAASSNDQNLVDSRQVLISAFQKAYPEITVELRLVPFGTDAARAALTDLVSAGADGPDVYLGDVIWPAEFAAKHLAMPLDGEFHQDFWARFDKVVLNASRWQERIYAVPYFANRSVLYYRPDLLRRVHRPVPTTWEELADTAARLRTVGRIPHQIVWQGDAYEGLTCVWTEFAASAGGGSTSDDQSRATIDTPPCTRALRYLRSMIDRGLARPDVPSLREPQTTELFVNDEVAFMRGWNTADTALATSPEKYAAAPLPTFAGRPAPGPSTIGGWSMFVNPHTRRLDAARTFIDWMTRPPAQRTLSRYGQMPANDGVLRDLMIDNDSPVLDVARRVSSVARPANTPHYPELSRAIYTNIHRALLGSVSPEQALADAQRDITTALRT
ncbi:extracellular solute-binding protein [Frankia sp. R82]|uniref:extracellular solute-binding protein n=1 Tax=Frankia sp. R82 TaxID=2950553 RepID=UPI0020441E76|nr:extracellular solute-binding protein [Frankia sp. R82]MCM3883194.1 extracellular solute-binding protein [Frankia sp. R82]